MVTEDRSRGQVILIGAIALAFIILGVVVVFNGVLYTETISSGSSSQSASTATVTADEVDRSVACLLAVLDDDDEYADIDDSDKTDIADEINEMGHRYQERNVQSMPTITQIAVDDPDADIAINETEDEIEHANVTVSYDSHEFSYDQTRVEIEPNPDCLEESS